ncbi:methyltransferase domain-containing protein [Embleya sp. NPDC005971]|uniref:class I SAM-dependent methyltransferase n=1 Tax=Embleya sp. NPDC005971 TaxID=3156724 RepID=UPI0033D3DEB4
MTEHRLFSEGTIPEHTRPDWYADRDRAPHLEQAAHGLRLRTAADFVVRAGVRAGVTTVVDLGAGDGGLLSLLPEPFIGWGYDLQPTNVTAACDERRVDVRLGDVVEGDIEWGDIAVATEMLEHLVDPHAFVRRIAEHSPILIASSPWGETSDDHYEFHTWAWDRGGYAALLEQAGYAIRAHTLVGPFQVVAGVRA